VRSRIEVYSDTLFGETVYIYDMYMASSAEEHVLLRGRRCAISKCNYTSLSRYIGAEYLALHTSMEYSLAKPRITGAPSITR